jgi:septum formation protein
VSSVFGRAPADADARPSGDGASQPLVLASGSPRRADLLRMLGIRFEAVPADLDEERLPGESPEAYAQRTAREKAAAVAPLRPGAFVLAADTIVVLDGEVLGKPADRAAAAAMLLRLQGREHRVQTAVAVADPDGAVRAAVETTRVRFRPFDRAEAAAYAATGEPLDKAGAYGIQGQGATLVEAVDGDFFAVMGLPIVRSLRLLEAAGWRYQFRVPGAGGAP